ncbi:mercury resistance system periplasmic binding protein MerP [Bradyrhizobium mercantei]|uniref:mercury resistance system periplasmic binding protein MerP n=1 Tax=Bradyrhizobium mercantei TaxID=1904807 RepID=UPI0009754CF0|nr:mercury resistance system periplasmic binding protein MerP [Bradyrhizobium mercantei]
MNRLITPFAILLSVLASSATFAAEKTVTLAVRNMDCAACPHIVKASLEAVAGVTKVAVSFREKTAVVTYDDSKVDLTALTSATSNAGYPSAPKG